MKNNPPLALANPKLENRILYAILAMTGLYVAIRAWLLPITVDEASTALMQVPRRVVDTLLFETDNTPNNHILNTLLIKITTGMFGWHQFVVRIPVLLGALLYGWASLQLVRAISPSFRVRLLALLLMLGNPYLLEFFSFARGYGLAAGLMTMAIWQAWRFFSLNEWKPLRNAGLFAGLAVYANFTLLIFCVPFIVLLFWACWQLNPSRAGFWKKAKPLAITTLVFMVLLYTPLARVAKSHDIATWNALDSCFESVKQFIGASVHHNAYLGRQTDLWLTWFAIIGALASGIAACIRWKRIRWQFKTDPRVWVVSLLFGAIIANLVQVWPGKTPYLQPRLFLFYWPLFALAISCGYAWVNERFGKQKFWIAAAPLLLLGTINTVRTLDIRSSHEWYHDIGTFTVLDYLKKSYEAEGRKEPYLLDTEWFMQNSFLFHIEKNSYGCAKYIKLPPFHGARSPMKGADFYYAINSDRTQEALADYDIVLRIPNSSLVLMRHKK